MRSKESAGNSKSSPQTISIGEDVFASGLETLKDAKPLNNCRWTLFKRGSEGWQLQQIDPNGRTREPCPLVTLAGDTLILTRI